MNSDFRTVVLDTTPPTVTLTVPPPTGLHFAVSWAGDDQPAAISAGLRGYDVLYQDNGGSWTPWLTGTTQTSANFLGQHGHTYTFGITATDNVNNSAWQQSGVVTVSAVTKYYTFGGQRVAMRRGDMVYYLHGDHLGSTSLTTDQTGAVVAEARYKPYGEEYWPNNGEMPTDFGFTGQRHDAYTELAEFGARWYDPRLGRWLSPDSIIPDYKNPQNLNRFSYVLNNPLNHTDSSGHCIDGVSTVACVAIVLVLAGVLLEANASNPLPPGEAPSAEQGIAGLSLMAGGTSLAIATELTTAGATAACASGKCGNAVQNANQTINTISRDGNPTNEVAGVTQTGPKFWNQVTNFQGVKVYQRNDLIDPTRPNKLGETSLNLMQRGRAAIGPDGKEINLHHMLQTNDGPIAEVSQTFHQTYKSILNINPDTVGSAINRSAFRNWKELYWMERAQDFQ